MRNAIWWVAVVALASGCASPPGHHEQSAAQSVAVTDQWATAGDMGMAAVFGTFTNTGHRDAHIVSGTSPAAGRVEVHEVVPDASGAKTMRPKAGGITVPAGGTRELAPGGDHLMLMDLTGPLQPGAHVALTVMFDDRSTLPVTAQIRDFAGGNEEYQPSMPHDHG
ncbi:copper chaperone PCu(A)C [Mycolicibacterium sp. S2-37]|uniref:copper chaperone PCu(A)C n=1 Tax=Mycolicibacterium sp. S2-37 TaxID=2810297 RepID=UPI001A947F54|nr:copper chaperone PCu(A)C [Mycolicibacterium sp. S2-37]MBO0681270.1 copper chaperone PCu(A)C [Mycolicibacterium sp. S2-37]